MAAPKPPDYNVSAVIRGTNAKGNVGVAWKDDENAGRISVKLFAFVRLEGSPDLFVTLFPRDEGPRQDGRPGPRTAPRDRDDDIPF